VAADDVVEKPALSIEVRSRFGEGTLIYILPAGTHRVMMLIGLDRCMA
jgi:hypothetical protein